MFCGAESPGSDRTRHPSLLAPRLRERRRIRQLLAIQRDLFRRFESDHATAADGIGLRVVFGIAERVGFHGHALAVFEHDGLAVGFFLRLGDDGGADGGVDVIALDERVLDADEAQRGAAGAGEGVAGDAESLDGRDAVFALGVVGAGVDGGMMGARADVDEDVVGDGDVAGDAADEAHAGVERDVAAHAGEGAAAHEAGAGHDEQALEIVLPAAILHHPARAFVIEPLGLSLGEWRGVLIEREFEIAMCDELCLAEKDARSAMDEAQAIPGACIFERGTQRGIRLQRELFTGHGFHLAPDAVEVLQIIGGVADGDVVHHAAIARGAAKKTVRTLPLAGAGSRAEVAVFPQMRAIATALAGAAFRHINADAVQGDVRRIIKHDGPRAGVEAGKAVAHAHDAEFAIRTLPVRIVQALHELRFEHVHPITPARGGRDVFVAQLSHTSLHVVERHAEAAVAFERKQALLIVSLIARGHHDAGRRLDLKAIALAVDARDAALDAATRAAVNDGTAQHDVPAVAKAHAAMPRRHLLIIEIEPERRAARVDDERMRRIALHVLKAEREDHLRAFPSLLPEAIIPRRDAHFRRAAFKRLHHHRHHLATTHPLRFLLGFRELRPRRQIKVETILLRCWRLRV